MDMMKLIRTRKSVGTFDGKAVTENDINKLCGKNKTAMNRRAL